MQREGVDGDALDVFICVGECIMNEESSASEEYTRGCRENKISCVTRVGRESFGEGRRSGGCG